MHHQLHVTDSLKLMLMTLIYNPQISATNPQR